jgi:hypothetical protein
MTMLPVCRAADLATRPAELRWLIEGLWGYRAVGICGGEPKCFKSFLALDVAVAVASGRPCLRRFHVAQPGRVVLFAGEDGLHEVRRRLDGIARAAGTDLATLDLFVITTPVVRLDRPEHRKQLEETVAALKPRLLVLDPFVRMHRIDENVSAEVAPLLAYLRELERRYETAVLLVHHSKKGAGQARGGQALRGSSELHAWGDSNLYVRRKGESLLLTIEHRTAASAAGVTLELQTTENAVALTVVDPEQASGGAASAPAALTPTDRIEQVLSTAQTTLTLQQLRGACKMRTATLCEAIATLTAGGRVTKDETGYRLAQPSADRRVSISQSP